MRRYLRSQSGSNFFFTVVTHNRQRIFTSDLGRFALRTAIQDVQRSHPFRIAAIVLLPDHLHTVWELPENDANYSTRWRLIKSNFTRRWINSGGAEGTSSLSRVRKQERSIWQRRFYEHTCRDEKDLKRCLDYTHVNPLKHGLVNCVADWPWSTFHRYVQAGFYSPDWGSSANWYGDEFLNVE